MFHSLQELINLSGLHGLHNQLIWHQMKCVHKLVFLNCFSDWSRVFTDLPTLTSVQLYIVVHFSWASMNSVHSCIFKAAFQWCAKLNLQSFLFTQITTAVATECLVHWACMSKHCQWATSLAGGWTSNEDLLLERKTFQYRMNSNSLCQTWEDIPCWVNWVIHACE